MYSPKNRSAILNTCTGISGISRVDCLKIVPSHWKALGMEEEMLLPSVVLIFGGEALSSEVVAKIRLHSPALKVVNHYGPTETTIGKLLHVTEPVDVYNRTIPIGRPFSNSRVYVLSKDRELCPVGIAGELYIGGDGLARGYLNNEELTAEKFIEQSFEQGNRSGAVPYRRYGKMA